MMNYMETLQEELLHEFIVGACQILPKSYDSIIAEPFYFENLYAVTCGSTMEFYIRPLNSGINDVDALILNGDELVVENDFPELPFDVSRLHDTITCYQMETYPRFPGFVRLRQFGDMNYNWKYKRYEVIYLYDQRIIYKVAYRDMTINRLDPRSFSVRGPAVTFQGSAIKASNDLVTGIWCPQWPNQARKWSERPRSQGWPTNNKIAEVVQQGCHVVYAQHRVCRDDERQWRLSFSVAEVILIQSWTQTQQIVYHLLKFFSERELIRKNCHKEDEVLCTYHLKTLMLWTCEEMPPEWWNFNYVIVICSELFEKLSEWLKRGYCPNYFIPEANLFHESFNQTVLDDIKGNLKKFCKSGILCQWFVENYLLPIVPTFCKVGHEVDFGTWRFTLYGARRMWQLKSLQFLFIWGFAHGNIYTRIPISSQTIQRRCNLSDILLSRKLTLLGEREMLKFPMPVDVSYLTYFDKTVYCLNTAYSLGYGEISGDSELFEYVRGLFFKPKTVRCKYHTFPEPLAAVRSQLEFLRAQELMGCLTGLHNPPEFQLLFVMSMAFLKKTLECDDSQSKSIAPAALVYMAALRFATSENKKAMDLCSAVLMDQTTKVENETLNAGCLLFIDDVVRIVGFSILCEKFNKNKHFTEKHIDLDLRLTAKAFANYLTVASNEKIYYNQCERNPTSKFSLDYLLSAIAKRKSVILMRSCTYLRATRRCVYRRMDVVIRNVILDGDHSIVTDKIIAYLTECALENMASFYSVMRKDFGIQCTTADCYRALYFYKCCQYDEVLHLCERILQEPDQHSDLMETSFAYVLVKPPLDSFFDRDVQSLVGLRTLIHFLSPLNDELQKFKIAARYFQTHEHFSSLLKHYSVRRFHKLGRHFLMRYLKLRCYIDCNHPYRKALSELLAMKSSLAFENIIRLFLRQRHRKTH